MRRFEDGVVEQRAAAHPARKQHDVMGIDEAGHQQERPQRIRVAGTPPRVPVLEPRDDPIGDQRVSPKTTVGHGRSVRLGPDPAGEAVRPQRIGVEVGLHGHGVDDTVGVVGGQRLAGLGVLEVGVRDVPLAVVVRVVARGPQPVAQCRHLAAAQPPQPRIVVPLAETVGLRDPVQVGVLAREQGRPAGGTRQRARVMPSEAHAVLVEPAPAGEGAVAPVHNVVGLVRRDRALFVSHEDDDVGPLRRHLGAPVGGLAYVGYSVIQHEQRPRRCKLA